MKASLLVPIAHLKTRCNGATKHGAESFAIYVAQTEPIVDDDGIAAMSDCEKAQREGKWTDLSEKEAKEDARPFFEEVEAMVRHRDQLGQVRNAMTVPIEVIGTLAELILSAALSLQMNTAAGIVAGVPNEVPFGPPRPPQPVPAVNARSLGSDKRMTPDSARPASPGKTPKTVSPN